MSSQGKVIVRRAGPDLIVSDESGQTYTLEGYGSSKGLPLDLDPRIDLTRPIYEQVQRLASKRRAKRPHTTAA